MKSFDRAVVLVVFSAFAAGGGISAEAKMIQGSPRIVPSDVYAQYDKNNNGKLEAGEIATLLADFAKAPSELLKAFDRNSDGMLSDEEIAAISSTKTEDQAAPVPAKKKKKK